MLIWVIFAILTAFSLTVLLWPLARPKESTGEREEFDASVYKDQLEEVEADVARGLMSGEDAEAAKIEISRRLLALADLEEEGKREVSDGKTLGRPVVAMIIAVVLVPFLSVGLYLEYGAPGIPDQPRSARVKAPVDGNRIDELVARVEEKLRANPNDGTGWDVVAPVYLKQRRYGDAADAYANAIRLKGEDAKRLFGFGEATRLANNGIITEAAREAFAKALSLDGSLFAARFSLVVAKEQDGRFDDAVKDWKEILATAPADLPWRVEIERRLAIADARANGKEPPAMSAKPRISEGGIALGAKRGGGPTKEQIKASQSMSPKDRMAMINNMVNGLAERLKENGNDAQGWLKLVRAYSVMGRSDDAKTAVGDARKALSGQDQALTQIDALARELGIVAN